MRWLAERKSEYQLAASGQEVGTARRVPVICALLELDGARPRLVIATNSVWCYAQERSLPLHRFGRHPLRVLTGKGERRFASV